MQLEKPSLFSTRREFFFFLSLCCFILSYSLLIEYNNYKNLTQFDTTLVEATVLKQYPKTKITQKGKIKNYQVLKCRADEGFTFYTNAKQSLQHIKGKKITLEIWASKIDFYEYMTSFYAFSKIKSIPKKSSSKEKLNQIIDSQHSEKNIVAIYQALYTATPLPKNLQQIFSSLGVSHLLAISGFHLTVIAALLFFLFKSPYKFLQNRYFPYRSYSIDSFIVIAFVLLTYLLFLDIPASLLRAYVMLLIGFFLYDRGIQIISMWTLFLTVILILSFAPRLLFSLGFWLSVSGVFYIFLFLIHFDSLKKIWQFILIPFWVYLMMLPISLFFFESFSLYHPLSIFWTTVFTFFYPLSILAHLLNYGNLFDSALLAFITLPITMQQISLSWLITGSFVGLSFASVWSRIISYILLGFSLSIFIYSIYNMA